jgi:hypothetical protein
MKKRHHHVFRSYLKSWTVDGKSYCLRKSEIFPCDLMGVAVERYFYEPQILEPPDIFLIEKAIIEPSPEGIKPVLRNLLSSFVAVSEMKKRVNALDPESPHYSQLEEDIINFEEDYQTTIEERLLPALRSMLAGTANFYHNTEQSADFLNALCVQYTRSCAAARTVSATTPILREIVHHGWLRPNRYMARQSGPKASRSPRTGRVRPEVIPRRSSVPATFQESGWSQSGSSPEP